VPRRRRCPPNARVLPGVGCLCRRHRKPFGTVANAPVL
jgi:hypothetical protein